jgi:exopolysaccharide biosynthesis polyprenyl glycosylphosphotransferase
MSVNTTYFQKNLALPTQFVVPPTLAVFLLMADFAGVFISVGFVLWMQFRAPIEQFNPFVSGIVLSGLIGLYIFDAYCSRVKLAVVWTRFRFIVSLIIISIIIIVLIYLSNIWEKNWQLSQGVLLASLGIFPLWAIIIRFLAVIYIQAPFKRVAIDALLNSSRWLIVGASQGAYQFKQDLAQQNQYINVTLTSNLPSGVLKEEMIEKSSFASVQTGSRKLLSGVVVATQAPLAGEELQTLAQYRLQGVPIYQLPEAYEKIWYKVPPNLVNDSWFVFAKGFKLNSSQFHQKCKRVIDIVAACILLGVLSPLMLLAAVAVKLNSPGSLLYSQVRSGLNGQHFRVYKFRSMFQDAELRGAQWAIEHDPRVTRVGRWLRLTRIDELPQLWNVLNGEMSLIGPRPERPEFDVKLAEAINYYNIRYSIKPGITGWAQVMYPYGASIDDAREKLSYDLYYIKHYSLALDLLIALKTIRVVLLGKGR